MSSTLQKINGTFALIEAQHPFACRWYGEHEKDELYFQWLIDGRIYMRNLEMRNDIKR